MNPVDAAVLSLKLLLSYWRVPLVKPPVPDNENDSRRLGKFFALVAVVVLGFAIRGPASGTISATLIPVVAAFVARVIDSILRAAFKGFHDGIVMPLYVMTPLIMFEYLFGDTILRQTWHWYQQRCQGHEIIFQVSAASLLALVVLLLLSCIRQKAIIGARAIIQAAVITLVSGCVVYLVAKTPAEYVCFPGICGKH